MSAFPETLHTYRHSCEGRNPAGAKRPNPAIPA